MDLRRYKNINTTTPALIVEVIPSDQQQQLIEYGEGGHDESRQQFEEGNLADQVFWK